jgi:hypothetical protein
MKLPRRIFLHLAAVSEDVEKWAKVIKFAHIKSD